MHQARKRFGQHFLHDESVLSRLTERLALNTGDQVLEIGPGRGALTEILCSELNELTAIEIDRDLVPLLRARFSNLTVIEADVLKVDFKALLSEVAVRGTDTGTEIGSRNKWRIVGNLPYNISTPLLDLLIAQAANIRDMHFMLQKEVVNRLSAEPGGKSWGRLGIMIQYHCKISPLFDVPPESFTPPPKVDSAIVRLEPYTRELIADNYAVFKQVVRLVFTQRRKTLRNALKTLLDSEQIAQSPFDLTVRPERLSLDEFIHLANWVNGLGD